MKPGGQRPALFSISGSNVHLWHPAFVLRMTGLERVRSTVSGAFVYTGHGQHIPETRGQGLRRRTNQALRPIIKHAGLTTESGLAWTGRCRPSGLEQVDPRTILFGLFRAHLRQNDLTRAVSLFQIAKYDLEYFAAARARAAASIFIHIVRMHVTS